MVAEAIAAGTAPVADPEVQTETQAIPTGTTQVTLTDVTSQSADTEADGAVQTETAPDEATQARQREREAILEEGRAEGREAERQERQSAAQTEKQRLNFQSWHDSFGRTAQAVRNALSQWTVQDNAGDLRRLTPQEINTVISPWEAHHGFVVGGKYEDFETPAHQALSELVPKETYEKLAGKPITKASLEALVEAKAEDTTWGKKAKSSLAKAERDLAEEKQKNQELIAKYGPPGDPKSNGTHAGTRLTLDEIDNMPMSQWMSKPLEERNRLREEARR